MNLTDDLRAEYDRLFDKCEIRPERVGAVKSFIAALIAGHDQYASVANATGVPWFVIGLIHGLEGSFSFATHLHNGDSLKHRTVNVPAGRPAKGDPPFSWQYSAIDALQYDGFTSWHDWTVAGICYKIESYNGWGYRRLAEKIDSPYLWSFSNLYHQGKFGSDGHYSPSLVSQQVGAIVALKQMVLDHVVNRCASPDIHSALPGRRD